MSTDNAIYGNFYLKTGLLSLTATGLAYSAQAIENTETEKQPNVIIVQTDDQGMGDWSWFGEHPYLAGKTPNIEQMAKDSVFMTNFHAMPLCAPSRAALQTGRHSYFSRVWQGRHLMRAGLPTIADLFKANGYKTAIFGKWHLGHEYPYNPEFRGYDESVILGGGMFLTLEDYSGNNGQLTDPTLRHNGKFEKFKGYSTDLWFNLAMDFLEKNKNNKFFLMITPDAPHAPHTPPKRYQHAFDNIKEFKNLDGSTYQNTQKVKGFYGQILGLDEDFGKLRKKLSELNLDEKTILIYCSDNGSAVAAPIFNGSATHYPQVPLNITAGKAQSQEGGHREPFFVYWKGHIEGGKINNELVHNIDIIPTLIELCHLNKSPFSPKYLEGQSFAKLLLDPTKNFKDHNYYRFATYSPIYTPPTSKGGVVMQGKYRLFAYGALFDVSKDVSQHYQYKGADAKEIKKRMFDAFDKEQALFNNEIFPFVDAYYVGSDKHKLTQISATDWNVNYAPNFWLDIIQWDSTKPDGTPSRARFGNYYIKPVKPGLYKISLYRWFPQDHRPINDSIYNRPSINAAAAELKIAGAGIDIIKKISANPVCVEFSVNLPEALLEVDGKFLDKNGKPVVSAYFIQIEKIKDDTQNLKPVAVADNYKIPVGNTLDISAKMGVLINDTDAENNPLTPTIVTSVSHGKLDFSPDGSFVYTPQKSFSGVDQFTYKLNDSFNDSNTVPVSIEIFSTDLNIPVTAHWEFEQSGNNINIVKDETGNYSGKSPHGFSMISKGVSGLSVTFDKKKQQFIQLDKEIPLKNSDFSITSWIKLKSYPEHGMDNRAICGGGFALVIDSGGNQRIIIPGKPGMTMQISPAKSKIPLNTWVFLTFNYNHKTGRYNFYLNGKKDGGGVWKKQFNGSIKFIGKENDIFGFFDGQLDDLTIYQGVLDQTQITALAEKGSNFMNHPPVAKPESYSVKTNNKLIVNKTEGVLKNDWDPDKDNVTVKTAALPLYGKLQLNNDGSFTYTPNPDFKGLDSFDYSIDDGKALSKVITVGITVK